MNIYTRLLQLYPPGFYRQFADQMSLDFVDGFAAARESGFWAVVAFVVRCYRDLVSSVVTQWLQNEALIVSATSISVALAIWAAALYVAAYEWPNGPVTAWFLWQIGIALLAGSVLTQGILRINR